MKLLIGFLASILLFASQCNSSSDTDTHAFTIGEPFTVQPALAYKAQSANLKVEQLVVSEDSRCPEGTNCVWEGQAIVNFTVDGQKMSLTLQNGTPKLAMTTYKEYRIEAQQLNPYPIADKTIDPSTYKLTLLIQKVP